MDTTVKFMGEMFKFQSTDRSEFDRLREWARDVYTCKGEERRMIEKLDKYVTEDEDIFNKINEIIDVLNQGSNDNYRVQDYPCADCGGPIALLTGKCRKCKAQHYFYKTNERNQR